MSTPTLTPTDREARILGLAAEVTRANEDVRACEVQAREALAAHRAAQARLDQAGNNLRRAQDELDTLLRGES